MNYADLSTYSLAADNTRRSRDEKQQAAFELAEVKPLVIASIDEHSNSTGNM